MKLHLDRDAFRVLIESVHKKTGYSSDVLEKDYAAFKKSVLTDSNYIYEYDCLFSFSLRRNYMI